MKYTFALLVCLLPRLLCAQVGLMSVTDENKHTQKEDFYHTFEYFVVSSQNKHSKCQATRIAPHWFATAAHCVKEACTQQCTIQMDLLDTPVSVLAKVNHTPQKPRVFVHPGYRNEQLIRNDFALIHLDLQHAPKVYYRRANAKKPANVAISRQAFDEWMIRNTRAKSKYRHVLSPSLPPIAVFDKANYLLERNISVIAIFDGKREVKPNPHPVYYVKDLGFAYTTNFGVRPGMSGSGVMTNTGELIGIISASMGADIYRGKHKIKHTDFFMFPVFDKSLIDFMRETLGSDWARVDQKDAYPYLAQKTHKDFSDIQKIMQKLKKGD